MSLKKKGSPVKLNVIREITKDMDKILKDSNKDNIFGYNEKICSDCNCWIVSKRAHKKYCSAKGKDND